MKDLKLTSLSGFLVCFRCKILFIQQSSTAIWFLTRNPLSNVTMNWRLRRSFGNFVKQLHCWYEMQLYRIYENEWMCWNNIFYVSSLLFCLQVLSKMPHSCKFSDYGCKLEHTKTQLETHEKDCGYRLVNCVDLACQTQVRVAIYLTWPLGQFLNNRSGSFLCVFKKNSRTKKTQGPFFAKKSTYRRPFQIVQ